MRIGDYKQTTSKDEALNFIKSAQGNGTFEITIYNKAFDCSKLRRMEVYIDTELAYVLCAAKGSFWSKRLGEFYLSKGEGWYLCKYLECYAEGGVTPHWWPRAELNIRRHGDPLSDLREAMSEGLDIKIEFTE